MTENETQGSNLPAVITASAPRPSLAWSAPTAAFVSQLIAARDHMPTQRVRRTATIERAVGAYSQGSLVAVRRMPEGYRKTVVA